MGACETACCGPDGHNIDTQQQTSGEQLTKPFSQANLFQLVVSDEKALKELEGLINQGANPAQLTRAISKDPKRALELLVKVDKNLEEYQSLCLKDADLSFRTQEQGSMKFMGQMRLMPVYGKEGDEKTSQMKGKATQQGTTPEKEEDSIVGYEYAKCGYGRLIWPDGSTFEGYWINGQACGVGVYRAPEPGNEVYEGYWQQDRMTNLCVFRQNHGNDIQKDLEDLETMSDATAQDKQNGKGIEVWSDGSYYHGHFKDGVKDLEGVYYWADGSRYTGMWSNDEMSGFGCFQWADGRYFEGEFQNGVMHGFGNYVWQDGRKYEGSYRFNKKHGEGVYTYSDGSRYQGQWSEGMQHGEGCIIDAESTYERRGIWANGKLKQWVKPQPQDGQKSERTSKKQSPMM